MSGMGLIPTVMRLKAMTDFDTLILSGLPCN